jgi:glutamine synthetase
LPIREHRISALEPNRAPARWSLHSPETFPIRGTASVAQSNEQVARVRKRGAGDQSREPKERSMSGNTTRLQAIETVMGYEPPAGFFPPAEAPGEIFGENVFTKTVMQQRLPKPIFKSLMATIEHSKTLDPTVADVVAAAMKDWAMEKGATHYAHVFYPLTGLTAEKHDSFFEPGGDGSAIAEFAGKTLTQGEPDASSFPNGGLRATFEARGYTGWDVTSPAYILENPNGNTLCIPTVFVSMTGEALDHKTPLLRSQQAMAKQAERVLKLFGHDNPDAVVSFAGAEQEYFLIDRSFFISRPDLLNSGRTLFGAKPPKGQEFDDHYFGAIPERVLAFMLDCERELFKLGIPAKTRHNEVAPGQFELAPMFERSNVAADHQQLLMVVLKRVAQKHGMECLFHEKPFEGINGSGKHVNFSLGNATEGNLLLPGDTPHENAQFLVFCAAVIRSVHKYGGLLRASVASATNDHRLGANEAPPAIISIFLGDQLTDVFDQIAKGGATSSKEKGTLTIGVDTLPVLPTDPGDRNRTSPFAFTGNRFEFRAPGSLQSIAGPMVTINTILAEALDYLATEIESLVAGGSTFDTAVQKVLEEVITNHGAVVFNGDGYTDDWQTEAASRGLKNLRTTLDALPELINEEAMELFEHYGVFSHREMHSRFDIALEQYALSIGVEARLTLKMATTLILPAATRYQTELATNISSLKSAGVEVDSSALEEVSSLIGELRAGIATLRTVVEADGGSTAEEEAAYAGKEMLPAMSAVRSVADTLESLIADDLWPLATYQEMLFIL